MQCTVCAGRGLSTHASLPHTSHDTSVCSRHATQDDTKQDDTKQDPMPTQTNVTLYYEYLYFMEGRTALRDR